MAVAKMAGSTFQPLTNKCYCTNYIQSGKVRIN
uniref:Uncharacterized protein n=1 Tax=Anguilla anguilla TaxID=7936 RepID=A0A0E9RFG7_ANGAN